MATDTRISQLTELTNPQGNEWAVVDNVNSLDVEGFPKTQKVRFNVIPEVESILYAALLAKQVAGTLTNGKFYLITDATTANIPLMVQATSASTIGTDAKSPDYPQDQINYNFLTDTILQRYDSINDILVCQDLRNLVGLTIGSGCSGLKVGRGVTGSIGTDCVNGEIGNNSTNINIGNSNVGFYVSENCSGVAIPIGCEKYKILYSSAISCNADFSGSGNFEIDSCNGLTFETQIQIVKLFGVTTETFPSDSLITTNIPSQIYGQGAGACFGTYFTGGVLTTFDPTQV